MLTVESRHINKPQKRQIKIEEKIRATAAEFVATEKATEMWTNQDKREIWGKKIMAGYKL